MKFQKYNREVVFFFCKKWDKIKIFLSCNAKNLVGILNMQQKY